MALACVVWPTTAKHVGPQLSAYFCVWCSSGSIKPSPELLYSDARYLAKLLRDRGYFALCRLQNGQCLGDQSDVPADFFRIADELLALEQTIANAANTV